jgi:hypothetical protein
MSKMHSETIVQHSVNRRHAGKYRHAGDMVLLVTAGLPLSTSFRCGERGETKCDCVSLTVRVMTQK